MEGYAKYKLLKRYHSSRDIVVVSREDGDNIGCELDKELGENWIRENELVFGPNIAFYKSSGTSNPGLFSANSLPDNVKPYYKRYQELKANGMGDYSQHSPPEPSDPKYRDYEEYLQLEDMLQKTINSTKSLIDTNDNAVSTVYEGVYFPFLSCFRGYYQKMNSVTIPITGETICDFYRLL